MKTTSLQFSCVTRYSSGITGIDYLIKRKKSPPDCTPSPNYTQHVFSHTELVWILIDRNKSAIEVKELNT